MDGSAKTLTDWKEQARMFQRSVGQRAPPPLAFEPCQKRPPPRGDMEFASTIHGLSSRDGFSL